jgi:cellulose synthase/poly-beta-1,6-N-acetylglucosamine synthase-like glycosyltransferase
MEMLLLAFMAMNMILVIHVFLIYPTSLPILSTITNTRSSSNGDLPSVELIIAAYNEDEVIAEKIQNSLSLNYPQGKITITVFSDASSDNTDEIVESYTDRGVQLKRIEGRVGKTKCQNITVSESTADIIVFSDADSMYEPDAIKELVSKFSPSVGCVVGELKYRSKNSVESESVYRIYERFIKRWEARCSSVVGGNGSIYAVRRKSYVELSSDAISDFGEPLEIVKQDQRVGYAKDAVAWENTGPTIEDEQSRRERIVTRSWNTLAMNKSLLLPWKHPIFSYQLWSHTALRWLTPVFLVMSLVSNSLLAWVNFSIYGPLLLLQLAFYLIAGIGSLLQSFGAATPKLIQVPLYFVSLNIALLKSLVAFIMGQNIKTWETIER